MPAQALVYECKPHAFCRVPIKSAKVKPSII
jgi:hypothetical protein